MEHRCFRTSLDVKRYFLKEKRRHVGLLIFFFHFGVFVLFAQSYPTQIMYENFSTLANGVTVDNRPTGWTITPPLAATPRMFCVYSHRLHMEGLDGEITWTAKTQSVSKKANYRIGVKITAEGGLTQQEYVKLYCYIDGKGPYLLLEQHGNFGTYIYKSGFLNSENVQIYAKVYNSSRPGIDPRYVYYIEEYQLFSEIAGGALKVNPSADVITCASPSVKLVANANTTANLKYAWSGPNGFYSVQDTPVTTIPGQYTLTATIPYTYDANSVASTTTATFTVAIDTVSPKNVTAFTTGGLTCKSNQAIITAASTTEDVTYSWEGPGVFESDQEIDTVLVAGIYTVTVTNPVNGCVQTASTNVVKDTILPGASAVGGEITCSSPSVTLSGSSPTTGVTYKWIGPGSFTSALKNPVVSAVGTYYLTVTDPSSGCISTATAAVTSSTLLPGAAATGGTLTCSSPSVTISGSSPTSGATYSWSSPGGYASSLQNPTVTAAGTYTLTVTNPANGCQSTATATVSSSTSLPGVTATGGTLTCSSPSVTISGSSSTSGATYSWSSPGGYASSLQNPTVTTAGTYTLTVTNPANGCQSTAIATVSSSNSLPGASASANGNLSCAAPTVVLSGTSSTNDVTYSWSGPGSFASTAQNPVVSSPGTYNLTVSNTTNGCSSYASVTVILVSVGPGAVASVSGNLTCASPEATLLGSSPTSGVTYNWTGPGGFTSTLQNPVVSVAGSYFLSVSDPNNNCVSTDTVEVVQTSIVLIANATVAGNLTCKEDTVTLLGSANVQGVTYQWSGPNNFISTMRNPKAILAGVYTLTVTGASGGCTSSATVEVKMDMALPGATAAVSGIITCADTSVVLYAGSSIANASFQWTGPKLYFSNEQNALTSVPGAYTLLVENPINGCISTATVNVEQNTDRPDISVSVSGILSCQTNLVQLTSLSTSSPVEFNWTGPNGFTSTLSDPFVSNPGLYTLLVTNPASGCFSSTSVEVVRNIAGPGAQASATVPGMLTCSNISVTLLASSSSVNVNYQWDGPDGFSSIVQNPVVATMGVYTLTVISAENGCTSSSSVYVGKNVARPGAVASTSGQLNCAASSVILLGSSPTTGVIYKWLGPTGFTTTLQQNPTTSINGNYTLIVTNPVNECTSTAVTVVYQNTTTLTGVTATNSGPITCTSLSSTLSGNSSSSGIVYHWSGPNNFTSDLQNAVVYTSGVYTLVASNPNSGCSATATTTVLKDSDVPNTSASGGTITCTNASIVINASSSTTGTTFSWSGPGGFTSLLQNPTVARSGNYILTVTNPSNGCYATAIAQVLENNTLPGAAANVSGILTCNTKYVTLLGSSPTQGVTFGWSGPEIFNSTEQNAVTAHPGMYSLVVSNPANGCSSTSNVTVVKDSSVAANVKAAVLGNLTCLVKSVTLNASSSTSGVTFNWSGPNGFNSTSPQLIVSTPGNYILSVNLPGTGCKVTTTTIVLQDTLSPQDVNISSSGIISCAASSVMLTGSSSTGGVLYNWSGPGMASSGASINVAAPGSYSVTVINPSNGCSLITGTTVIKDQTLPSGISVSVSGTLTCTAQTVQLSASSFTSGAVYHWAGPGNYISNESSPYVSLPGAYQVTVTNPYNECSIVKSLSVRQDVIAPEGVSASVSGIITCTNKLVSLLGASSSNGVSYNWSGPNGFTSFFQNPLVSAPGLYYLTVSNLGNGCSLEQQVSVGYDTLPPAEVTASVSGTINCVDSYVTLTGSSSTPGASYYWSGPDNYEATETETFAVTPGDYIFKVTAPNNGCATSVTVAVIVDKELPVCNILDRISDPIEKTTNALAAQVVNNASYSWVLSTNSENWRIIDGANSTSLTYFAGNNGTSGTFTLVVTDNRNGCANSSQVTLTAISSSKQLLQVRAYPNPFTDVAYIEFIPLQSGHATIQLYTSSGVLAKMLLDGEVVESQSYQVKVDGSLLTQGTYYIILKLADEVFQQELILVK